MSKKSQNLAHVNNIKSLEDLYQYDADIRLCALKFCADKLNIYSSDDIVNDVYIKLHDKFDGIFEVNGGYIFKMIYSQTMQHLKDNKKNDDDASVEDTEHIDDTDTLTDERIALLIKHLDPDEYDLLVYSQMIPISELAEMLDNSYWTLYLSLKKLKIKAKKIIEKYE